MNFCCHILWPRVNYSGGVHFLFSFFEVTECEIFLSLLVKFLDSDKPFWQRALALEVLHTLCVQPQLLRLIDTFFVCKIAFIRRRTINYLCFAINSPLLTIIKQFHVTIALEVSNCGSERSYNFCDKEL